MHVLRRHPRLAIAAGLLALLVLASVGAVWAFNLWPRGSGGAEEDSGDYHWQQAQQALAVRDFGTAKKHLGRCLELWPASAEAHFLMARTCRRQTDDTGWETHLEAARVLGWPHEEIALEARLWQAQMGDVWAVEQSLRSYLQSDSPEEVLILEALVQGDLDDERLGDALDLTRMWQKRHPDDWMAWLYHGRALYLNGATSRAVDDYDHVVELRPEHGRVHLWRAAAYMTDKRYAEALADFRAYLHEQPDDADALFGIAQSASTLGQTAAAREALDRLLHEHKEHVPGLSLRAQLDLTDGKMDEALRWLKRAEALTPHDAQLLHTLARTLRQLNRDSEARKYERRFEEIAKRNRRLQDLMKQIRKEPGNASLRFRAAALSQELGREAEAAAGFRSVLWLDPGHPQTHQLLAEYYQRKGDATRAAYHRRWLEGKGRPATGAAE